MSLVEQTLNAPNHDALGMVCVETLAKMGERVCEAPRRSILLVEDIPDLADHVARHLREVASDVSVCNDGESALDALRRDPPDLVVLDIGLPRMSGLEVCRAIRAEGLRMPILMLSGRGGELDRIVGLEFGADDYMVKPFSLLELLARVRALFRRAEARLAEPLPSGAACIRLGDLMVDSLARQAVSGERVLELTEKEFDLFHVFVANPGRVYSRSRLLDLVWGCSSGVYEYTVTTHINRLRRKVEVDPAYPRIIQTVWGLGYRLNAQAC